MKRILIATTVTVSVGIVATAAAALAGTTASSTNPVRAGSAARASELPAANAKCSTSNSHGTQTISYCGPATATLHVGTKTYSFKNGECQSIQVSGITVDVTLGAIAEGKSGVVKGNAGKPYFSLDLSPGQNSNLLAGAYFGGKKLSNGGVVSPSGTIVSKGTSKGTFKSAKGAYDNSGKPFSVSGSWNCHGAFAKH